MELISQYEQAHKEAKKLEADLADPAVFSDPKKLKTLHERYAELKEILRHGEAYRKAVLHLKDAQETLQSTQDEELRQMALEEAHGLEERLPELEHAFALALLPPDPLDRKNVIVEIRAGTGGDEAASFAADLLRMYTRFTEEQGWKLSFVSANRNDLGGFKEAIVSISGVNVYGSMKFESGVHRVQRVPDTEKQGRVHTSTATVAILPEVEEVEQALDPKDLKIETTTAGGHGGQSVNTTYSAVRILHIPTGITVSCQDERSQTQNREKGMRVIRARVSAYEREKAHQERAEARRGQIGSAERSEKIRTYNFSQDRITDHRINANFHNVHGILDGKLGIIIDALKQAEQHQALEEMA